MWDAGLLCGCSGYVVRSQRAVVCSQLTCTAARQHWHVCLKGGACTEEQAAYGRMHMVTGLDRAPPSNLLRCHNMLAPRMQLHVSGHAESLCTPTYHTEHTRTCVALCVPSVGTVCNARYCYLPVVSDIAWCSCTPWRPAEHDHGNNGLHLAALHAGHCSHACLVMPCHARL